MKLPGVMLVVLLGLAACAPRIQQIGPDVRQPVLEAERWIAADGAALPMRHWLPRAPGAVLVALHGFNDYGNAFDAPARYWCARGLAVYAYDQRGFGATEQRGLWPGAGRLVSDLGQAVGLVRERHPGLPLFVLGDSMGGAVVMAALAAADAPAVDGAILVAPAVRGRETMNVFYSPALWLAAHTLPWLALTGRGLDITPSDNLEMLRALSADPLVIKQTRVDTLYGLVDLMDTALASAAQLNGHRPLVLYGQRDDIVPKEPTRRMLQRLPLAPSVAVYPDGYHMLLRDLQARTVWDDVLAWIDDPNAPLPSAADSGWQARLED